MSNKRTLTRRNFVASASLAAASTVLPVSLQAAGSGKSAGTCLIPTARGDAIPSSKLGLTLPTELIIQESTEVNMNWPDVSWGGAPEEERIAWVVEQLKYAHENFGVDTIIDRTIPGIGRNVPRMQKVAKQVPVNIIVTTGWYTLYELPYYFHYRENFPEMYGPGDGPSLEDFIVRDIEEGILDTGVRAAAIKVLSDKYGIEGTPDVRKVFGISARAHRRTGAPLLTHTVGTDMARLQQDVFLEDGVDLSRVVLGHLDRAAPDAKLSEFEFLLDRGSFISFDGWGNGEPNMVASNPSSREKNLDRIVALINKGYGDHILISAGLMPFYDAFPQAFRAGGNYHAYSRLAVDIIPTLKEMGVSDADIKRLTVDNPRRVLESKCLGGY
ncbi:phosphotriesterase family protein [Elongatibacter sediminis]|uniref:Phosphotriesterase n=1 Tax=Elongatibacter sediminis TaxID=3119006 RepID=A0AAW9R4S2_9GAMM